MQKNGVSKARFFKSRKCAKTVDIDMTLKFAKSAQFAEMQAQCGKKKFSNVDIMLKS
jgi:hypothetical protein